MEWIHKVHEPTQVFKKFVLCIFLAAAALLTFPEGFLERLHLAVLMDSHGIYIGVIGLVSGALLLSEALFYTGKTVIGKIRLNRLKKASQERIRNLDESEKAVLREFFLQGQNTIKLPRDHPVVAGLIDCGILRVVGDQGRMSLSGMLYNIKISEWIRPEISSELLNMPSGQPTPEESEFLSLNRPGFMSHMLHSGFFSPSPYIRDSTWKGASSETPARPQNPEQEHIA